jgi:hypothetical protein
MRMSAPNEGRPINSPPKTLGLCDLNSALVADATPEPCPRYLASQPMKRADPRRATESDYCVIGSKTTLDPWLDDPSPITTPNGPWRLENRSRARRRGIGHECTGFAA